MPAPDFRGTPTAVAILLTLGALGVLTAVGLLGSWLGDILDVHPPGGQLSDSGDWYRSFPTQTVVVSSLYAGFTEEVLLLATPVGLAGWAARRLCAPSPRTWMVLGGTAGLIFRSAMHWYQGWTSPLMVLLWGGSLLAIYLAWQSVYPLIAAHALHNFVIAWLAPQTDSALAIRIGVSFIRVAALALAVAVRVRRRAGAPEPGS